MTNEEFQKVILAKLEDNDKVQKEVLAKLGALENGQKALENGQKELKIDITNMKIRQDEIYQVVRAIEHSNIVGKSEIDSHNIRIAKVEGKIKRVAKACIEENEIDKASNL